jgi:thiol-disulfide isomerase/thioredoxin
MRRSTWYPLMTLIAAGMMVIGLSCGSQEHVRDNPGEIAATPEEQDVARAATDMPPVDPLVVEDRTTDNPAARDSVEKTVTSLDPLKDVPPLNPGAAESRPVPAAALKKPEGLPRLVDLGAGKCVPCKMMAPILEELKRDYTGQFDVEFIDVWKDPEPGRTHRIRVIPTQIFFDTTGKELWRHEGFFGKEDILKKWEELGVTLRPPKE